MWIPPGNLFTVVFLSFLVLRAHMVYFWPWGDMSVISITGFGQSGDAREMTEFQVIDLHNSADTEF